MQLNNETENARFYKHNSKAEQNDQGWKRNNE